MPQSIAALGLKPNEYFANRIAKLAIGKLLALGKSRRCIVAIIACNALQRRAMQCNEMQCTATICNALQRRAMHCKGVRAKSATCNDPTDVFRKEKRVQTPRATRRAKRPKHAVFPE